MEGVGEAVERPMKTRVVHCKKEPFDVYIGRPGEWGNPFLVSRMGREGAIAAFRAHVAAHPGMIARIRSELRGKVLGCYCTPDPCHGDVYVEIADSDDDYVAPAAKAKPAPKKKERPGSLLDMLKD